MDEFEALALAAAAKKRKQPPKSLGQRIKENLLGDDDPTTQNFGERIGSAVYKAGESMTFGLVGDEASAAGAAALPGGMGYDERLAYERQQEKLLEQNNPGLALGSEVGGAVLGALLPGGAIGTLARGASLPARIGASAAAGAGMGATYGAMEGEGLQDRLRGAQVGGALGGVGGAVVPLAGAGVQKVADSIAGRRAMSQAARGAPSQAQQRAIGESLYQQVDDAGVQIKPQAFDRARLDILDALRNRTGFDELPGPGSLTPKTARVAQIMGQSSDAMASDPTAALPFKSLDQMRRQAGAAAGNVTERADQQAGMTVIEGLDDFVSRLGPDDVVAGDVDALKTAIPKARDVWSRMKKSQLIDDAMEQEGNYLSGGASAVRNRVASILRNEKLSRGFTEAEKKALQRVVSGSLPQQLLNYLGSGLGMMGQMGVGFAAHGLPGAMVGAGLAAGSRKASEAVTRRNAELARAIVANGRLDKLPVATDSARKIAEALLRRGAAGAAQ